MQSTDTCCLPHVLIEPEHLLQTHIRGPYGAWLMLTDPDWRLSYLFKKRCSSQWMIVWCLCCSGKLCRQGARPDGVVAKRWQREVTEDGRNPSTRSRSPLSHCIANVLLSCQTQHIQQATACISLIHSFSRPNEPILGKHPYLDAIAKIYHNQRKHAPVMKPITGIAFAKEPTWRFPTRWGV